MVTGFSLKIKFLLYNLPYILSRGAFLSTGTIKIFETWYFCQNFQFCLHYFVPNNFPFCFKTARYFKSIQIIKVVKLSEKDVFKLMHPFFFQAMPLFCTEFDIHRRNVLSFVSAKKRFFFCVYLINDMLSMVLYIRLL